MTILFTLATTIAITLTITIAITTTIIVIIVDIVFSTCSCSKSSRSSRGGRVVVVPQKGPPTYRNSYLDQGAKLPWILRDAREPCPQRMIVIMLAIMVITSI